MLIMLCLAAVLLAYSNGANDSFKGVATIWGSGVADYGTALGLATVATVIGAVAALYLASGLVANFSGRGLVPSELAGAPQFIMAVVLGAGSTVLLATHLGFPISTTHAIIGGLVGGALAAPGHHDNLDKLGGTFLLPLLFSPVVSASLAAVLYWLVSRALPEKAAASARLCLCDEQPPRNAGAATVAVAPAGADLRIGTIEECTKAGASEIGSLSVLAGIRGLHFLSAGTICFARAVNDTPKLAALLLGGRTLGVEASFWAVAAAMAVGGWLSGRRVAETMGKKIVPLAHEQGLVANLVTSGLVLTASSFALPVSTTHVSVGSISGTGFVTGKLDRGELARIALSWVVTLPLAALIAMGAALVMQGMDVEQPAGTLPG
jgi:PiT family inorganic phosphate transporter